MNGKNVLITGASGGIGQALATAFSQAGYGVILQGFRNIDKAQALAEKLKKNGAAVAIKADLTKEDDVEKLFSQGEKEVGFISVLINNAGISHRGLFTEMTAGQWHEIMDTNCTSAFLCCRRALPPMIREKQGAIINISSMWGQVGASCEAAYSASKAALIGLTKALAKEEGPSGIRVNCLAPGVIDTAMNRELTPEDMDALKEETPLQRIGTPEEVAAAALFLAESPFITGQTVGINGGFVI